MNTPKWHAFTDVENRPLDVRDLGTVEYSEALRLQESLVEDRRQGKIPDTLLLLEHPPVITLGRAAKSTHVLFSEAALEAEGISLVETGRGGDVTYHGPGQVVGYPIVNLAPDRKDVRKYVKSLEATMIDTCKAFGVPASLFPPHIGVWVDADSPEARKIGAIGVRISRWLTTHGFALNVDPDLDHFSRIIPCGISTYGVTSLHRELGSSTPGIDRVKMTLVESFQRSFHASIQT